MDSWVLIWSYNSDGFGFAKMNYSRLVSINQKANYTSDESRTTNRQGRRHAT